MHYLTKFDGKMYSSFWVIPTIASANLCKPIHDIVKFSTFSPFESGKCGKEGKKLQNFEYLESEKCFLDKIKSIFHSFLKIKSIFHSFLRANIWSKNEKWQTQTLNHYFLLIEDFRWSWMVSLHKNFPEMLVFS